MPDCHATSGKHFGALFTTLPHLISVLDHLFLLLLCLKKHLPSQDQQSIAKEHLVPLTFLSLSLCPDLVPEGA